MPARPPPAAGRSPRGLAQAAHEAAAHLTEASADLERVVGECGFETTESAVRRCCAPDELAALESASPSTTTLCWRLEPFATMPGSSKLPARPAPDLAALTAAQVAAAEALADAEATHAPSGRLPGGSRRSDPSSLDALAAWAPVREAHELAAGWPHFVEGKAADNRAQMRLSAYVLVLASRPGRRRGQRSAVPDDRPALRPRAHRRQAAPARPAAGSPAGPRRVVGRGPRPGDALRRRDLRGLPRARPGPGRRGHPGGRRQADLDTLFVDEGFGSSTPTPSTT